MARPGKKTIHVRLRMSRKASSKKAGQATDVLIGAMPVSPPGQNFCERNTPRNPICPSKNMTFPKSVMILMISLSYRKGR